MLRQCVTCTRCICRLHDNSSRLVGVRYKYETTTATADRSNCSYTTSTTNKQGNCIPQTISISLLQQSYVPLSNNRIRMNMIMMSTTDSTTPTDTAISSTNTESSFMEVPPSLVKQKTQKEIISTQINNDKKVRIDGNESIQYTNTKSSHTNSIPFYGLPRQAEIQNDNNKIITITNSTILERIQYLITNCTIAYNDPKRADAVGNIGEVTGSVALYQLLHTMKNNPVGQILLHDRPIVTKNTIHYNQLIDSTKDLSSISNFNDIIQNKNNILDTITFGQAYGIFLLSHNFDPNERSSVQYLNSNSSTDTTTNNDDIAYVMTRYRQCHDYYHVVTGLPPTLLGEIILKGFELYQTLLPLTVLSTIIGSQYQLTKYEQHLYYTIYQPWYIQLGQSIPYGTILNIYYEKHFNTSLQQLRQQYNIIPAPPIPTLPPTSH